MISYHCLGKVSREMEPGLICRSLSFRCSDFAASGLSSRSHGIHSQPAEVLFQKSHSLTQTARRQRLSTGASDLGKADY